MNLRSLLSLLAVFAIAAPAFAQTQYWDLNATGPQNWNNSLLNWGATANGSYGDMYGNASNSIAVFQLNTGSSTVMVGSGLNADQLQFTSNGFTLTGGSINLGTNSSVNVSNGLTTTINSALNGSNGFTKAGGGTLTLGGTNGFTGTVAVTGGTLALSSAAAFGSTSNGLSVSSGAAFDIGGNSLALGSLNGAGTIRSTGASAVTLTIGTGGGTGTFSGVIAATSGTVAVTKTGAGLITLSGTNTFTGKVTIGAGTLVISGANSYTGGIQVDSGATLRFASTNNVVGSNNAAQIDGTMDIGTRTFTLGALTGSGAINNATGTAAGTLTLGGGNGSGSYSGSFANGGSFAFNLAKSGSGTQAFTGTNTSTGTVAVSAGTLNLQSNFAHTGTTTASGGTLLLDTNGAITASSGITISGGTLRLSNTDANNLGDRVRNAANITFSSGTLDFNNTGTSTYTESLGTVSLTALATIINATAGSGTSTLTLAALTRTAGNGIVNFTGAGLGTTSNRVVLTAAPTLNDPIIGIIGGWATVNNTDWATYDSLVGSVATFANYTATDSATWISSSDVKWSSGSNPTALLVDRQINSLILANTTGNTVDLGTRTLRIESGGLLALLTGSSAHAINNGTLTVGEGTNAAGELIVNTAANPNASSLSIGANLSNNGSGALRITKFGSGLLELAGNNTYTGLTLIKAGTLRLGSTTALGTTANGTTLTSGAVLDLNGQAIGAEAISVSGTGIGSGGALINSSGTPASASGTVTLSANNSSIGGTGDLTFSAAMAGMNNTMVKIGTGKLTLNQSWNGTGGLNVQNGILQLDAATNSAGTLTLGSSTGNTSGRVQIGTGAGAAGLTVTSLATSGTGTTNRIVNGTSGLATLTANISTVISFGGFIGGASAGVDQNVALVKSNTGSLALTANNTYTGGTTISAGTLLANGSSASPNSATGTGAVAVNSGGTLGGTGRVGGAITVNSGGLVRGDTGATTGTLTVSNTTVKTGGIFFANLAASGTNSTLAVGANTLNLETGSILRMTGVSGFTSGSTSSYSIATLTSGTTLQLDGVGQADNFLFGKYVHLQGGATGAVTIDISAIGFTPTSGDTLELRRTGENLVLTFTPIPEPGAILSVAVLAVGAFGLARRRFARLRPSHPAGAAGTG